MKFHADPYDKSTYLTLSVYVFPYAYFEMSANISNLIVFHATLRTLIESRCLTVVIEIIEILNGRLPIAFS